MGSRIRTRVAIGLLCVIAGCMTFEVEGAGSKTSASHHGSATVHGSLYRTSPWNDWTVRKCDGHALKKVEFHTNALLLLASIASLGIYVPQTVEWWCVAPPKAELPDDDVLDLDDLDDLGD